MLQTILIFDADVGFREGIAWCMRAEGYRVLTARDRTEALRSMFGARIDLLLLDLSRPVTSGYAVLRHMAEHEALARLPVVVVTREPEQAPHGMVVLTKPFPPDLLMRTIAGMIGTGRQRLMTTPRPPVTGAAADRDRDQDADVGAGADGNTDIDPIMSNALLTEIKM
jgi:CheY-like chemotaxis protein